MTARRAGWLAGCALLVVYVATLAPSVTFWDSGEFIAAARVLGIPHPPGTPLYVVLLNVWARLLWFLPFAAATNLFSAVCTAAAAGLTALWIGRSSPSRTVAWAAFAAALSAGAMTTAWLGATETEVYAVSLLLAVAAIIVADHAGRTGERRWTVFAAYLLSLALPLHLSALVAAPVVVLLAADRVDGRRDWGAAAVLFGVCVAAIGVSRLSATLLVVGLLVIGASAFVRDEQRRSARAQQAAAVITMLAVACSALLFLLIRARHDPPINQANPATWHQLGYTVGRQQYAVAGLWPRQAPLWLQIANWFEYADWQFALSLGPTVIPTVWRVGATLVFTALGVLGSVWHRAADRRTWRATALLLVCGSLGVIVYLNLKAGTSFAWSFVPGEAHHEARDRDYFFVLGFWAWGMWAGMGALALARRLRLPMFLGVALAAAPIALNWSAVNRRLEPEASLPREVASLLLDGLPANTVLFVAGDNDSYPLWYAQQVERRRRDVTVVTIPLLGAAWYQAELSRRSGLSVGTADRDAPGLSRGIANSARRLRRPVAVSLMVPEVERNQLSRFWTVIGLVAVDQSGARSVGESAGDSVSVLSLDSTALRATANAIEQWLKGATARPAVDPVNEYFLRLMACPGLAIGRGPPTGRLATLDTLCNLGAR